jgi:hypothetical protein
MELMVEMNKGVARSNALMTEMNEKLGVMTTARAHSCAAWVVWRDGSWLVILDSVGSIG